MPSQPLPFSGSRARGRAVARAGRWDDRAFRLSSVHVQRVRGETPIDAAVTPTSTGNLYRTPTVFAIREDVECGLANRGFPPFRIQPRLARSPTLLVPPPFRG